MCLKYRNQVWIAMLMLLGQIISYFNAQCFLFCQFNDKENKLEICESQGKNRIIMCYVISKEI